MKHILNDLSNEEKNSIREQHTGGMKVITENFSRLLNAKLGDAKPLVEQSSEPDYKSLSDDLVKGFKGAGTDLKPFFRITNEIQNKNQYNKLKSVFGVRDGQTFEEWIGGDIWSGYEWDKYVVPFYKGLGLPVPPVNSNVDKVVHSITDPITNMFKENMDEQELGLPTETPDFNLEQVNTTLSPLGINLTPEEASEIQPECEAPYSGPFADVVAKISEKLDTMSIDGLKNTLKQVLSLKKKQPVQEQLAPVIIAGVTIPGVAVAVVLGAIALIIVVKIVKAISGGGNKRRHGSSCKRRRKLVKKFGIDGNFM